MWQGRANEATTYPPYIMTFDCMTPQLYNAIPVDQTF